MSHLYCWFVGDRSDRKHVMVVASNVEEARTAIMSVDIIAVNGDHNFDLNQVCRNTLARRGYTWKKIIQLEEPITYDLTPGKILAFQHGTG